ncbi:MAG: cysteine--tRNA ligase [Candidatus Thorarchaeota archaeon]|nr:MAG: cysteine--tRNA ligase [Candidatus Thorarchaeota archaeon]
MYSLEDTHQVPSLIQVFNTLTRSKEEFVPLDGKNVRVYACGPTVYDYPHIGNARSFVVFDTMRRYLEYSGYRVHFITNFTDVDDKMIARAHDEGTTVAELAAKFIAEYQKIAKELNLKPANANPRATEHIDDMIDMIKRIVENGMGYVVDGNVYFDVSAFAAYGNLSKMPVDQMTAEARIEPDENKQDPRDFALWKAEKPGEPSWDSPWGKGRPGWHAECSAMSRHYLGVPFDIHGGGQDLIFPHHENEIAQTASAYSIETPVKYWLHNGFLTINKEKMSKSLGNFFTAREVLDHYNHQAVRLFLISAQYRQPLDYNPEALNQATQSLERLRNALDVLEGRLSLIEKGGAKPAPADSKLAEAVRKARDEFEREMNDDFNTPGALAEVFTLVKSVNTYASKVGKASALREARSALLELMGVLGIDLEKKAAGGASESDELLKQVVNLLLQIREEARKSKNYALSDRVRKGLADLGITVSDTKDGPTWKTE